MDLHHRGHAAGVAIFVAGCFLVFANLPDPGVTMVLGLASAPLGLVAAVRGISARPGSRAAWVMRIHLGVLLAALLLTWANPPGWS